MKLVEEYLQLEREYKKKYGNKTFLLFQVGSFFEVYGLEGEMKTINKFSQICNLAIASKKICVGKKGVYMAGFRDYILDKYIKIIHPHGYICVVYVQKENQGKITRELFEIYTPATTFIDDDPVLSNNISCLWIQKSKQLLTQKYIFGLSNVDVYTGKTNICEYCENYYHNPTTYDSIEKFLCVYNPIELVIIHNLDQDVIDTIVQYLNCKSKKIHMINVNEGDGNELSSQAKKCENQVYQDEIIQKFYPYVQNKETFKYNLFEKTIAYQSLCFLLNFIELHNSSLVYRVKEPIIENETKSLICANHSLKQLNIIDNGESSGQYSSLSRFLNNCKTKIGKRYMNYLILNPISDIDELNKSYNSIDYFLKKKYDFSCSLSNIKDIEKMMTKIKIQRATPYDYNSLCETLALVESILSKLNKDNKIFNLIQIDKTETLRNCQHTISMLNKFFDLKICNMITTLNFDKYPDINHTFIKQGNFPKLDKETKIKIVDRLKLEKMVYYLNFLFSVVNHEKELLKGKTKKKKLSEISIVDYVKINELTNSEMMIVITKKRRTILKEMIDQMDDRHIELEINHEYLKKPEKFIFDLTKLEFKDYQKSTSSIHSEQLDKLVRTIYTTNQKFNDILKLSFNTTYDIIVENYWDGLCNVINFIQEIDVLNNKAFLAKSYNYCKPIIKYNENSYIHANKLRHPLIEHIETNETYVSNDVNLGENKDQGILLFGTNAVGKTSLIKSLGIAVIMAQSGMYVPCEKMTYMPYKYIFTRIIGNDNLFKGLSTFGVEMSELRVILNNCNNRSLILGDELCSGTEIDSALAIFISGLETMKNVNSTFIFATHFHQIKDFDEIKNMNNVSLKHMKVLYNHELQKLVYDRKLQNGPGESIYGLEVCKSLNMPDDFIKRCYDIRNKIIGNTNNVLSFKITKYNKEKVKGMCEFCNIEKASEIHHLQYQKDANKNDYINNTFHKNHKANLASICEKCHVNLHRLGLVYSRKKTNEGYEFILIKK